MSAEGDGDSDTWTQLVTDVASIVAYTPPNLPPPSVSHRYVFVLWRQPAVLDATRIHKALGLAETMGRWARIRWDGHNFEIVRSNTPYWA
ncbi:hypothetical protein CMQ_5400 [Grosmannia clavigera kw1407]|uniref:Phosphatidylethanolamine-binding protein n=1 Tax=Grosmannia clavigera (strain kw1407 / UAMH 11150) TaxID=655863 RepID=F0XG29_GROCL|nr:uncharacterized protein CMQ_5400 [Grosmannia clavigera kw1407]EFX03350.1 hypothetical protein CMQ_5400 [Grosmannia clavigera kw1407]